MSSGVAERPRFNLVFSRKRKRSSFTPSEDPNFVLPGIHRDQIAKHRSCWMHLMVFKHGQQATRKQAEETEDEYDTAHCYFNSMCHGKRSKRSKRADPIPFQAKNMSYSRFLDHLDADPIPFQAKMMSSRSFADHLEIIWSSFPLEKTKRFAYLECLWFGLYRQASQRTKVLSWIKRKDMFSSNYVFVPICCWSHWSLLILCHFGESLDSETRKPCMLLLDSLRMAGPMRFEQEIRKFVSDIYKEKGISDDRVSKIPLLIPKVPQQTNKECGSFALYFIKKFMEKDPAIISNGYPSFMEQNWFTRKDLDDFCRELERESRARKQLEVNSSRESMVHESWRDGDVIIIND